MKIKVNKVMKAKASYPTQRETVVTSSFRACSFAMDDGGRCLLDVINDPKLLQSFLESGSDDNSKDPQDGTSSESAVESPQVSRSSHATLANHLSATEHIVDQSDQMGYSYVDSQGLLAQGGVCSTTAGLGGMSLIVASSSAGPPNYQHASTSGATIHHLPSVTHTNLHPHSPASARSVTPVSHNIKSPGQGPSSVHSMPPPSPLQQTRSPLPSHTPSPAPAWSPAPPVLSPVTSRTQSSLPSVAFQQSHNQILQTSCSVTQFVTALATQQSITQKLTLQQQQQQLFLQQQLPQVSQQSSPRLTSVAAPVVTTTAVSVQPPMVQLIHAQPSNVTLPTRTSHSTVRPIQPKLPPQILPKPATCTTSNQFVPPTPTPTPKQTPPTPVTTAQRTLGVGIQPGAHGQLVIGQGQPGVFSGPQGTIVLNQIIPGVGQSPIFIQGNLSNLANIPGLQLTLRPPSSASPGQSLNSSNPQNNATLIAALQGPSQHAQTLFAQAKSPLHGQQTIVIPNNIGHPGLTSQNINLTSAGIPNSGIISSSSQGQGFLTRSNIILSPRVVGNQSIQLQQIQTPNGPIFAFAPGQTIAVPHLPTALGNAQLAPVTLPMHGVMNAGQGVLSGLSLQSHTPPSALQQQQSLFGTAVPFTSHLEHSSPQVIQVPQPLAPQQIPTNPPGHIQNQQQQIEHSPKPASPPKPSKVPSVNLEELLKEHGIVPENSPVPSPECNSPLLEDPVPPQPTHQQLITALQSQQLVLDQSQGPTALSHLKLAFAQDGSMILQPHGPLSNSPRVQHYVSSGQVHGRNSNNTVGSVILPTVTTSAVSVPVITSESTPSRNHSTLIARLNAAPAISVPDVSSLALSTSVGLSTTSSCNTVTKSATTLVPLSVQSLSVNSSPIASSYVVQRTNTLPSTSDRLFIAEDVQTTQSRVMPVISSSSSAQNVQNKINHTNSTFQTIVVPNEHPNRTTVQHTPKTVQSSHTGMTVVKNSQPVQSELQKCGHRETHLVEIADNGTTSVPSHNHPTFSPNVPNHTLQRLQKEIHEFGLIKNRNPEQQKIFNLLIGAQQKLISALQNKSKVSRANQNQLVIRIEGDVEKLLHRSQACLSVINELPQQLQSKAPVISVQQAGQLDKSQNVNVKAMNSHNLHLVNLLKQNQTHNAPVRHVAPPTTTITTVCDSTTPTVTASTNSHQKVTQVIPPPPQPRLQAPHQHCAKTSSEVTQQQVIVRLQKPVQQQSVQTCPNVVQIKGTPPPVKKIVNTVPKTALIKEQLTKDQNAVINPDIKTPFFTREDACRRLLQYHVFKAKEASWVELMEDDRKFTERSIVLNDKINLLHNKYRLLQLQESMRLCVTPDQVLIERLFIQDEEEALRADRAAVAEGKTLSLPPPPQSWLQKIKASCRSPSPQHTNLKPESKKEEKDSSDREDCCSRDFSDHPLLEDSDPLYKEDDNLEAPVIDSCEDIIIPQHDDNCERSPPTLKRIVIKPNKCSESDSEEPAPSRKRFKFNNSVSFKSESNSNEWGHDTPISRTMVSKHSDKDFDSRANHKFPLLTRDTFHSDNRIDDMVTELSKEFDMSPMEIDDDDRVGSQVVDFDPPSGATRLADFEPPVPRTEESCDSNLLYNNSLRNNCADKYDFDLLGCSDWTDGYVHTQPNDTDMAVDNIISNHDNPSDLDLSGLDGLDDHLDDSQHCIPNGIQDDAVSAESEMNSICYLIPKHKRFLDSSAQPASNCSNTRDQVQSAIKSIIGTESRSYFDSVGADFMPMNRHGHNSHMAGYGGSVGSEMSTSSSHRGEYDLEEAVRSILL